MNFLFGKKKDKSTINKKPDPSSDKQLKNTIFDLKNKYDLIEKKQKFVETKIKLCVENAKKKLHDGDKKGAMFELKRKKFYEAETEKYMTVMINIEHNINMLESAVIDSEIFDAYKSTTIAMKQNQINIDNVDDIMDELEDNMDKNKEIGEAISRPLYNYVREDDINNEFEMLMAEVDFDKPSNNDNVILVDPLANLPVPPTTVPVVPTITSISVMSNTATATTLVKDKDLAELEAMFA